ncbi:MAG: hypothetical protein B6I19_11705 [Bacteroidetes bacterium 4572_114]|nr:MAG: hypothetical protein B6I19_11705 [Bacteroidetes bacterium 4572_114]
MKRSFVLSLMFVFLIGSWSCVNESNNASNNNQEKVVKNKEAQKPPAKEQAKPQNQQPAQQAEQQQQPKPQPKQTIPDNAEIVIGNEVGNDLGDFDAYDPDSTLRKLSDMRGKLTMLMLWNSKCGHCVTENQKHIETYNQYHDKKFVSGDGFDIYSIALDKKRTEWLEHLDEMNYPWETNVYVIDSWKDRDIRFFGIKNLPGTFLIDEDGIVIAKKFTATELKKLLEDQLEK